jgi:hypothetical protein
MGVIFLLAGLVFAPVSVRSLEVENDEKADAEVQEAQEVQEPPSLAVHNLSAPVIRDGKLIYFIYLQLKVVVGEEEDLSMAAAQLPRLRDTFMLVLHRGPLESPGKDDLDLDSLMLRLRDAANEMIGEKLVEQVVVTASRKVQISR